MSGADRDDGAVAGDPGLDDLGVRRILGLSVPIMVSNVSTPLLGAVDTAVVGRIPDPAHLGAVAIGALVFSFVFWAFGFLRMGTTGLTAQAVGARDHAEVRASLGRAAVLAAVAGSALVVLQGPIGWVAYRLLPASDEVEGLSRAYFDIRIWAAPATLLNYGLLGWFVGLGRARVALLLQLVLNLANMALDAAFVLGLGWGVQGVALGTVLAEHLAAAVGLAVASGALSALDGPPAPWSRVLDPAVLRRTLSLHRDILLRSVSLVAVFAWFTAAGSAMGDTVLAANAVLMQLVSVAAFFLDGIAFATETLVGRSVGARSRTAFRIILRRTTAVAALVAAVLSLVYAVSGTYLIDVLTVDPATRRLAREVLPWAAAAPLAGVWAFQLDGVFIGATRGREMRDAMLVSLVIFLAAWWSLRGFGYHGLWAALYVHYVARLGTLGALLPRVAPPG